MDEDDTPRCTIVEELKTCVKCGSENLRGYYGDVFESECTHCNDCNTSFGRCRFCEKCVLIDDYVQLAGLKNSVDVNSILERYPNCKYEKGNLEIPVKVWDECGLKSSDASDGTYTSYCAECENLLLISIWFME